MIRKFTLIIFILTIAASLSAEVLKTTVIDNSDYNDLTVSYNDNYHYTMKSGMPVLPIRIIQSNVAGRAVIDSIIYYVIHTDTLNVSVISGQDPLPRQFKKPKRSILKNIKSLFPSDIVSVKKGHRRNFTEITAGIAVFQSDGSNLYHHREINIDIFYRVTSSAESKSANTVLIITEDSLKSSWSRYSDIYRDFDVRIRSINDFINSYDPTDICLSIRQYAQELYADSGLRAMILGLDSDIIPGVYVNMWLTEQVDSSNCDIVTDKYYSCLDGDWNADGDSLVGEMDDSIDIYPDILLSRCPLLNTSDIDRFIDKIEMFKSGTGDTILLTASYLDNNTDGSFAMDMMADNIPFAQPLKKLYERNADLSSTSFIEAMDNGPFTVIHDGHGAYYAIQSGTDYTYNSDIDSLSNNQPIMMYSLSCYSAAYDYDCIAEHFLNNTGGGFYIGNSRYGWYTPYFPGFGTGDILMESFFDYFINQQNNPCSALYSVFDKYAYQITGFNDYRWAFMVLTYFGDPLINLERDISSISANMQNPVKNQHFSMTMQIADSVHVQAIGDSIAGKTLYPSDNLFSCPVYNEDTLEIHISAAHYSDTMLLLTSDSMKRPFLKDYLLEFYDNDSLYMYMTLYTDSADSYVIKAGSIADTLDLCTDDTLYYLSGHDTLQIKYHVAAIPENNAMIPITIGNDLMNVQAGINLIENTDIVLDMPSAHYSNNDTIFTFCTISNTSARNIPSTVYIYSDSLGLNRVLFSDSLSPFSSITITDTMICNSLLSGDIILSLDADSQSYSKKYMIAFNNSSRFNDCESADDYAVDSASAYFHRSINRSASGTHSYFSGYSGTPSYPANYITQLRSPVFRYSRDNIFGFSTFYDVEAGFDYCVVSMHGDSIDIPVITFSGKSDAWEHYTFRAEDYPIADNENIYMGFSFFSEDDLYQDEGWYVDDIVLTGEIIPSGIDNQIIGNNNIITYSISDNRLSIESDSRAVLDIFDISGRKLEHHIIKNGNYSHTLNYAPGIYFIKLSSQDSEINRKIIKLKGSSPKELVK